MLVSKNELYTEFGYTQLQKIFLNNQQTSKFGYTQLQKILNNQQTSDLQKPQINYNKKKMTVNFINFNTLVTENFKIIKQFCSMKTACLLTVSVHKKMF